MLNGLCWDDDYTIAQWLEHRWLQARVPGSSPGGDSQFFLQTFPRCLFPSNQLILLLLFIHILLGQSPQTYGLLTGCPSHVKIAERNAAGRDMVRIAAVGAFHRSAPR